MNKNKLIGLLILFFVLVVPFRIAFLEEHFDSPAKSMFSLLAVIVGGIIAAYLFLNSPIKNKKNRLR